MTTFQVYEPIPTGEYSATIESAELKVQANPFDPEGDPSRRWHIKCVLLNSEQSGRTLMGFFNDVLSKKSNLWKNFALPLFGEWARENEVYVDLCAGLNVNIVVVEGVDKEGDPNNSVTLFKPVAVAFRNPRYNTEHAKKAMLARSERETLEAVPSLPATAEVPA